jgi:predicted TIM-barrel fold metal-dependent hydrolase
VLTRALEIGVTCIAAHSGTGMILVDQDYFDVFVEMTRRFPRLYGDNSALACCNFRARPGAIRRMKEDPELAGRILHGSDVPVPVTGVLLWAFGQLSWGDWRRTAAIRNPLERDVQLKRAAGFGEGTFTRLAGLLRRPLTRSAGVALGSR